MNKTEKKILEKSIEDHNQIHISRNIIDPHPIDCIPLLSGTNLLLIQYLYDFSLDGYMIIRKKDVSSIRIDENEKFCDFILREEGIIDRVNVPLSIGLESWKDIFTQLKAQKKNIIIECENIKNGAFYIGKIVDISNNSVTVHCFNGIGEWDLETTKIFFRNITSVSFDKRYINIISKYLKPHIPNG